MPLAENFSTAQTLGLPNKISLTDTSTGSDVAVTQRRIYLQKNDGTFLVPTGTTTDYILWNYADASITVDVLTKDMALLILVQWLDVTNVVLYDKTELNLFSLYNKTFFYYLTQQQAARPSLIQDVSYFSNKAILWANITSAINAVSIAGDQANAQSALDAATLMINNENKFF